MDETKRKYLLIILGITAALYAQTTSFSFINWDDDIHIYNNPAFSSPNPLRDIWTTFTTTSYLPVVHTLFYLQWRISHSPHLFHTVNVILHMANILLIFLALRKMGIKVQTVFLITLIYAIHPMRVEAVCWATEQKTLLSSIFVWGAFINYLSYLRNKRSFYLFITASFYYLALFSKQTAFPLFFVLMAFRYLILGDKEVQRYLPEVFVLGGIGLCIMSIHWIRESMHLHNTTASLLPLSVRLLVLPRSIIYYLLKTLLPFNLCQIYPQWEFFKDFTGDLLPVITVISLMLGIFFYYYKKQMPFSRWLAFGYISYLTAILPVAGLFTIPYMNTAFIADRYSYLPGVFITIILVLSAENILRKYANPILTGFSMLCIYVTYLYVPIWREPVAFWDYLIKKNPQEDTSYTNLSYYYLHKEEGNTDNLIMAMSLAEKAIEVSPKNEIGYYNYGASLMKLGRLKEAEEYFRKSLDIKPDYSDVWNDLGYILEIQQRTEEAADCYKRALSYTPGHKIARYNLERLIH